MSYKVLVVDDEPNIHTFIRISLTAEGFEYIGAENVKTAKHYLVTKEPHIIVLDLGLPDGEGLSLLTSLRQTSKTPVLILTARDQEDEKICLLEAGANDYLSKPFGIKELMARIKVLVRDLVCDTALEDTLTFGSLTLTKSTNQCWLDGNQVTLTKKEFAFIEQLLSHPGQLVKQSDLLCHIWGKSHVQDTHYLRILISQLRRKLNDSADDPRLIKTEPGVGYRLVLPDEKT